MFKLAFFKQYFEFKEDFKKLFWSYTYIKPQVEKINFADPSSRYEATMRPPNKTPPIVNV